MQRYPITPITEKYFVYICSSFREKSGTCFKFSNSFKNNCGEYIQELGNLCSVPVFSFFITFNHNINELKRVIAGSVYSNCWVLIENFSNIALEIMQIISKEILILEQKYILAEINNDNEIKQKIIVKSDEDHRNNERSFSKNNISIEKNNNLKSESSYISELNSNYFKKYKSFEGEEAIINYNENEEKKKTIPSINKKKLVKEKEINRVAHGLFITYYEEFTLNMIKCPEKEESLKSCFR